MAILVKYRKENSVTAGDSAVKVFHAAHQDLEIFYTLIGAVPAALFGAQIAAMSCGFGDQTG